MKEKNILQNALYCISASFIVLAVLYEPSLELFSSLWKLIINTDKLINDYAAVAGFGAMFLNAGLLMFISLFILKMNKVQVSGSAFAAIMLMGGFGMFGKNIVNIWPIVIGVWLYAKITKTDFSNYLFIVFFGTSLAPVVTEIILWQESLLIGIPLAIFIGIMIGLLLPALASHVAQVHQGYNLYNVGFAGGLLGTIIVSLMRSFGYDDRSQLMWYGEHEGPIIIYMYVLCLSLIIYAFYLNRNCLSNYRSLLKRSGRLVSDFVLSDGSAAVLLNMGVLGTVFTSYILLVGGTLNGATIGGILTIIGFGGFGKHLRNCLPILIGIIIGSVLKIWGINEPSVLLGALFATGLAPIAGQYGLWYGILAGFLHLSLVLSIGVFHGGLNLYNNGFSAGLLALLLVPIIETFQKERIKKNETYETKNH